MTRHRAAAPAGGQPAGPGGGIYLTVAAGGAIGSLARWAVAEALPTGTGFPWATFLVNVTGSAALGVLAAVLAPPRVVSRYASPFLAVGCLGGFTTFSTYTAEGRALLAGGHLALAGGYLLASVAGGLAGAWAGLTLTRRLVGPRAADTP